MLLDPFEEKLDLPSVMIEFCNHYRADCHRIREEYELLLAVLVQVYDSAELIRILLHCQLAAHISYCIGHDTGRQPALPSHGLEVVVLLAPDHEVCTHAVNGE